MSTEDINEKEAHRMGMQRLEEDALVNISEEIKEPPIAISCGEVIMTTIKGNTTYTIPLATYGNFSFIQAPPKSMKTYFVSLLVSTYLKDSNKFSGHIKGLRDKRRVIHFDTEQGRYHAQKVFRRPVDMNAGEIDDDYHTYALRKMSYTERIDFIEYILTDKLQSKNIGLVVIDGIADLVSDVNNITESSEIVQRIMRWTAEHNCHIITVIHSNFGSTKPTGHLGSFLEKKTETQIQLEKNTQNKGWVTVSCKRSRSFSFDDFSFKVNEAGLPEVVDTSYLDNII